MQATVTLKGTTEETMTLAFCAYVAEGVLEALAMDTEDVTPEWIVETAVRTRVESVLGVPLEAGALRAMAMRIRTATLELPPVNMRIGNVQMALPATSPPEEAERPVFSVPVGPDGWSMPTTWPEFGEAAVERLGYASTGDVAEALGRFGIDGLMVGETADVDFDPEEMWERLVECMPSTGEVVTAWEAVDAVMTKADEAGGWDGEVEGATVMVEEIPAEEIAEVLAEAGLDVVVVKGPASVEEITEAIDQEGEDEQDD